jgi:L-histidine N-alpha-methyltransferase
MTPPKHPTFHQLFTTDAEAVQAELLQGLTAATAHTSPKFLYDALGSRLFEAITELPEYYPTRTEAAIFASHGAHMAAHIPAAATAD